MVTLWFLLSLDGISSLSPNLDNLGPLHTRAKSRDHDIVRAQRKCPKAVPTHLQHHVVWSQTFKSSVKPYATKAPTNAISINLYSCGFLYMIK